MIRPIAGMSAFWRGFGNALNMGGLRTRPLQGKDNRIILETWTEDWKAIGGDLRRAARQFEEAHPKELGVG